MKKHLYLIAAACSTAFAAQAQDDVMLVGGAEISGNHSLYGQVGAFTPLPGSQFGNGFVGRVLLSGLTYRYDGAPGEIDATALGGEVSLGYQGSDSQGWWGVYAGPGYRHTHLSPDDITSDARGGEVSMNLQAEAERMLADKFKGNINTSYSAFANNDYWARVRLLYNVSGTVYSGPEFSYQGNDDYKAWQAGIALLGFKLSENSDLGFKAGVRKTENFNATPYGGFEFGVKF